MKTKDETLSMAKWWMAEISDIQKKTSPAGCGLYCHRNTSEELNNCFTKRWINNYFSTSYEQLQNWLAEASVNSIAMLGKPVMAGLRLRGQFLFCATLERLGTPPQEMMFLISFG
jgi:hypothetical protein